jgi:hypothetical protein
MDRRHFIAALMLAVGAWGAAAESELIAPANRMPAGAPGWQDLAKRFREHGDVTADFEERRYFPFRTEPVVLKGEVRVSSQHGLSLHYTAPEERTVVLDEHGLLTREPGGRGAPPMDPRAAVANEALLRVLRFDFASLERDFEIYGRRDGDAWSLALEPRAAEVRRALGVMRVSGEADTVRRIELRHDPKQHIDIMISAPRPAHAFTPEELQLFFR